MDKTRLSLFLNNIPKTTLKRAYFIKLAVFMPLTVLLIFFVHYISYTNQMNNLIVKQGAVLEFTKVSIEKELSFLINDANYVKDISEIRTYVKDNRDDNKRLLEARLLDFARDRKIYDQIRVLDMSGYEVIRINQSTPLSYVIARESELQYKGDRYYYEQAVGLEAERVLFSEFDLNIEKGVIEVPNKPVIRISTGLYNDEGEQIGVIVLNYLGSHLFEQMNTKIMSDEAFNIVLINREGFYLNHEDPELNWGFMVDNNNTKKVDNASLFEVITNQESGSLISDGMTYIFDGVSIKNSNYRNNESVYWYLVSESHRHFFDYINFRSFILANILTLIIVMLVLLMLSKRQVSKAYMESMYGLIYMGIEKSPAVFVLTDENGDILYVNEKFEAITGYSYEEVVNENPRILKSGDMSEEDYKNMWETISTGRIWEGEIHNKRKDGSYYWANISISCIKSKLGKVTHYLAVQEDVTERKMLRESLEELTKTDDLTHIFNKRYLSQIIDEESFNEVGDVYTLMMFDIDYFKVVNDKY